MRFIASKPTPAQVVLTAMILVLSLDLFLLDHLRHLMKNSDRFVIMCRDPRDPNIVLLENNAIYLVGPDWPARLDKVFVENLGKFRKYDG
jgi:Ribonuclease 2-5A